MGRFLSRDAAAYDLQNSRELNRYGYVAANPVMGMDPSGLWDSAALYGRIAQGAKTVYNIISSPLVSGAISGYLGYRLGKLISFEIFAREWGYSWNSIYNETEAFIATLGGMAGGFLGSSLLGSASKSVLTQGFFSFIINTSVNLTSSIVGYNTNTQYGAMQGLWGEIKYKALVEFISDNFIGFGSAILSGITTSGLVAIPFDDLIKKLSMNLGFSPIIRGLSRVFPFIDPVVFVSFFANSFVGTVNIPKIEPVKSRVFQ